MLGLDAQTLAQLQQQQQQQQSYMQQNKHLYPNYSFDEQQLPTNSYYEEGGGGGGGRMNLLQQAQSHSFNMDMANSVVGAGSGGPSFDYTGGGQFDRNNPRRNTLKRGQRVVDQSNEELNNNVSTLMNMSPAELGLLGISPQQQQQILMNMRAQQYSNNSSGQESGIGSSVYTNSAHGTHDLLVNTTNAQMSVRPNLSPNSQINRALGGVVGGGQEIRPNNQSPSSLLHQQQVHQLHQQQHQQPSPTANQTTNSLDISQTAAAASSLPRRKSLPSIVKSKSFKEDETAHSSAELNDRNTQDMFIIENGIRKRVCEKTNSALNQNKNETTPAAAGLNDTGSDYESNMNKKMPIDFDDDETPQLPRKIVLESITSLDMLSTNTSSKRVSMPSIPAYLSPKFASKVMSREEANRLSSLRREELRQNRELENNRALRLKNMLKNVFLRNRLFLFIICSIFR